MAPLPVSARASLSAARFPAFSSFLPAGLDAFVPAGVEAIVSSQPWRDDRAWASGLRPAQPAGRRRPAGRQGAAARRSSAAR